MRRSGGASWKPYCGGWGSLASSSRRAETPKYCAWLSVGFGDWLSCADSGRPQSKSTPMASMDDPKSLALPLVMVFPFPFLFFSLGLAGTEFSNVASVVVEPKSRCWDG